MKILVTGGAGFIGCNLVHYLLGGASDELGISVEQVVVLDRLTYAGNRASLADLESDPRFCFVQGDIGDAACVAATLHGHHIDVIMHLAAESHVDRSIDSPAAFVMTNIVGTYQLIETYKTYLSESGKSQHPRYGKPLSEGGNCGFLHVSTDEVFGSLAEQDPAFSEISRYAPNSPYSASKASSDHLVRAYFHTYQLPAIITHCGNCYGPYQFPEKLIPLMIQKCIKGEKLPVYGDGQQVRDWIYVEDACRALTLALFSGTFGETYVIGGNGEMKNLEVVKSIIRTVQSCTPDLPMEPVDDGIAFVEDRPGHDRRYAIDATRIRTELGWQEKTNFSTGLEKTVEWYLAHPEWVQAIELGSYCGQRLGMI